MAMTTIDVLSTYLAATDSRDKLLKGVGCFFKLLGAVYGKVHYLNVGAATSDARSVMRLLAWLTNVRKLSDAMSRDVVQTRDLIYVPRVQFDGLFSLLDNVVYIGKFMTKSAKLAQVAWLSRASLFCGYVAAVLLDLYDLAYDKAIPDRKERYLVLTRNVCDMLSCIGNVSRIDLGVPVVSALGLVSAVIATRELLLAARRATLQRRAMAAPVRKLQ